MKASAINHRFVAIDEGLGTLLCVDERDPGRGWCVPIGHPEPRDLQLAGGHRILVGHHHGFTEFDLTGGAVVRTVGAFAGVTSVRRQRDGTTLVAGVNLAGRDGVAVLTLDPSNRIMSRATYPGDYVRLVRQTAAGTYLMCCNDRIREGSPQGGYLREFRADGFYHAWKAVRLPDGRLLVSAGYGAFLAEFSPAGVLVRRFGGKNEVPAEVNPFFYAMHQLLPDGHTVVANWQGHGPGHGGSGVPLLQFDPAGRLVWTWNEPERISSLQGVLVLDDLDTALLHDERFGTMQPVR